MEASTEIHDTMNLKTEMSENPWAVLNFPGSHIGSTITIFDFLQILCWLGILFKFDFENEFSCVVIVEATIELSRVYEKLT